MCSTTQGLMKCLEGEKAVGSELLDARRLSYPSAVALVAFKYQLAAVR